ncbi:hypothetical protein [Streptomyces sp. NPDC008001]|uniref:hypothetical protein n=1 Tax=Streptomyces sp. NPDC008001 TaxID=3364804 RepID=UPI0036EC50F0
MRSIRHVFGTLALMAALGGGLTACGPDEDSANGASAGASASAKPSQAAKGDDHGDHGGENDCGKPPTPPAGIKIIEVGLHRDASVVEATDAKPRCTPNDWIYRGGEGPSKAYKIPANVKAELAVGSGQFKQVNRDELSKHIDGCLRNDYNVVKQPFACYGNVYEITLTAKGDEIKTMRERWSV